MNRHIIIAFFFACSLNSYASHTDANEVVLRGKIINAKTRKPVTANVDIFRNSDFISETPGTAAASEFTAPLSDFGMYVISITAPGYIETTDTLWVLNETRKFIDKDFYVHPIEVGLTVTLSNIYFKFGHAELSDQSFQELDKTAEFFRANPSIHFEIAGHTDRSGEADYNLQLSRDRALAVVEYLTAHGVDPSQLTARGYGESKPIRTELTREAENTNRRVEFTVLKVAPGEK